MDSKVIYHSTEDRTPYCYLIGWKEQNEWYYGVRYAKDCHPDELWVSYFTSSKYVKDKIEKYGNPSFIQIRKTFNSVDKARGWEHKVLRRLDVINQTKWLNESNAISIPPQRGEKHYAYGVGFSKEHKETLGKIRSINYKGEGNPFYGKTHSDKARQLISAAAKNRTGWFHKDSTKKKISNSNKGKPKPESQKLEASRIHKNKLTCWDDYEHMWVKITTDLYHLHKNKRYFHYNKPYAKEQSKIWMSK